MSAYMTFFIRGDDNFYPIGTYNRSHVIYQVFQECGCGPWENISPITSAKLRFVSEEIEDRIKGYKSGIKECERKIRFVADLDKPTEELIEYFDTYYEAIEDYEKDVRWLEYCKSFVSFLSSILEEYEYTYDEDKKDPNQYVYCGVEVYKPTVEDIV